MTNSVDSPHGLKGALGQVLEALGEQALNVIEEQAPQALEKQGLLEHQGWHWRICHSLALTKFSLTSLAVLNCIPMSFPFYLFVHFSPPVTEMSQLQCLNTLMTF